MDYKWHSWQGKLNKSSCYDVLDCLMIFVGGLPMVCVGNGVKLLNPDFGDWFVDVVPYAVECW